MQLYNIIIIMMMRAVVYTYELSDSQYEASTSLVADVHEIK